METTREPINVIPFIGKTKLAGTQVIDAAHILSLIGSKVGSIDGIQTVNAETLRIIHEEIQELSNMGENEQAMLLKEFVDTELVLGKLSSSLNFDEAFEEWKNHRLERRVYTFAQEWGLDAKLLKESVGAYSYFQPALVPYIDELTKGVIYEKAANQCAGNRLRHIMALTKELSVWMEETKQKFR